MQEVEQRREQLPREAKLLFNTDFEYPYKERIQWQAEEMSDRS